MSLDTLLVHRVVRRKMVPATRDAHGDANLTHDATQDVTVPARVQPSSSPLGATELVINRDTNRLDYDVVLEYDVDVAATDELEWLDAGVVLKIDGPPRLAFDGIGHRHHLELTAYRVEL